MLYCMDTERLAVRLGVLVLVKAQFEVLSEKVSRHKAVFPDGDNTAVVDGKTQFC